MEGIFAGMKRTSWTDVFLDKEATVGAADQINARHAGALDEILHNYWELGRNIILAWTAEEHGIEVLVIPHYLIAELANGADPENSDKNDTSSNFVERLVSVNKRVSKERLDEIAKFVGYVPKELELTFIPGRDLSFKTIDSIVKRYSISLVYDRAVALFDAVGFSLFTPLEQVTQLNSLSYSVNNAYSKLLDKKVNIRFARTTTGDGFYIWNRSAGIGEAVDLYHFMHLVLADNAIAQSKGKANAVPVLRACFHVGPHYEFYQSEGLNPTTFSYIVGDVTIELARMIDKTRPGQILIGDFEVPVQDQGVGSVSRVGTTDFIEIAQDKLSSLKGLTLSGEYIESLKSYLTGAMGEGGSFDIRKYRIRDKHGLARNVFNAKLNIYRHHGEPIFLRLKDSELSDLELAEARTGS